MGARNGQDYLERLDATARHVTVDGDTVRKNITSHPAFRNVTRSYARLYDLQHEAAHRDALTYPSPTSGDRVGTSFMVPREPADLVRRRTMMSTWAQYSQGMLGRTGDYLNSALMALASCSRPRGTRRGSRAWEAG